MLYALFAMVLLTLIVGIVTVRARFKSVATGNVKPRFYKLMQGQEVPDFIVQTGRNFNNQFEVPVLFYTAGVLHIALGIENLAALILAWVFVVLRYVHAVIHLTYNHILHRMLVFFTAFFVVFGLWVNLMVMAG